MSARTVTRRCRHLRAALGIAAALAFGGAVADGHERARSKATAQAGSVPFQRAAGRIIVTLAFLRPDGQKRFALAWVNMGTPTMAISSALAHELRVGDGQPLAFRLGAMDIEVGPERLQIGAPKLDGEDALTHLFAPLPVEAILPASVLAHYQLMLDMPAQRLALSPAGTLPPEGVAVPIRVNSDTGVAAVEATINGERHLLALDAGASFTWLRGDLVRRWVEAHPEWLRAEGAIGASNMGLTGIDLERHGALVRLPTVTLADGIMLTDVAALGTAPLLCSFCDKVVGDLFWAGWERNAPGPVAGWLGANVLDGVRLTVDYPTRTLYWLQKRPSQSTRITQIGVTLERHGGAYVIGGIVSKQGRATVEGVEAGDKLLEVDGRSLQDVSSDDVLRALSGMPRYVPRHHTPPCGQPVEDERAHLGVLRCVLQTRRATCQRSPPLANEL